MDILEIDTSEGGYFNPEETIALMEQLLDQNQEQLIREDLESPFSDEWNSEDRNRRDRTRRFTPPKNKSRLFKATVRNGIDNYNRNNFYLFLSGISKNCNDSKQFWTNIVKNYSKPQFEDVISLFGYPDYDLCFSKDYLQNLLTIIKNKNKDITFSPMIPSVVSILSMYLKPNLVFAAVQSMISQDDKFFTKNKQEFALMLKTIDQVVSKNSKSTLYQHTKTLKLTFSEISLFVIPLLFSKNVDRRVYLTIFDAFIYDGRFVLMKYVIGIIFFLQSRLLQTRTASDFMKVINNFITSLHSPTEMNELVQFTFSLNFSKTKKILSDEKKVKTSMNFSEMIFSNLNTLPKFDEFDDFHQYTPIFRSMQSRRYTYCGPPAPKTITINQMVNYCSNTNNGKLLSNIQFHTLKQHLPRVFKNYNAYPVYLMSVDSTSMRIFFERAKGCNITMLIIKAESRVIGAVIDCPIAPNKYTIGGPTTTVFDVTNNKVYKSSLKNTYYVYVDGNSVSIGGGDSGCAIYFQNEFNYVISDQCETFDSPSLLDSRKEDILDIELYKLAV